MSGGINLPTVSAKIVGDASGLVSELKRAEVQTTVSSARISEEVGALSNRVSHRFSLAHIGTDALRGLGIATGFEAGEKGAKLIASYWEEAAKQAKETEESSQRMLEDVEKGLQNRRTDAMEVRKLMIDMARLSRDFTKTADRKIGDDAGRAGVAAGTGLPEGLVPQWLVNFGKSGVNDQQAGEGAKLADQMQVTGNKIDELNRKLTADFSGASDQLGEKLKAAWRERDKKTGHHDPVPGDQLKVLEQIRDHLARSQFSGTSNLH